MTGSEGSSPYDSEPVWRVGQGPPPEREPGELGWTYAQKHGGVALMEAHRLGYFDTPEAQADQALADEKEREFWGFPSGPESQERTTARDRPPVCTLRLATPRGRERRPTTACSAPRRRSPSKSRDGPSDDGDPDPADVGHPHRRREQGGRAKWDPARVAAVIAAGKHPATFTFPDAVEPLRVFGANSGQKIDALRELPQRLQGAGWANRPAESNLSHTEASRIPPAGSEDLGYLADPRARGELSDQEHGALEAFASPALVPDADLLTMERFGAICDRFGVSESRRFDLVRLLDPFVQRQMLGASA